MFSANENMALRQHKKRIVKQIEDLIDDEDILDQGLQVMVMQANCTDPGCVPIETVILLLFPKHLDKPSDLLPGFASDQHNFKTKIPLPLADVQLDDIQDALPPPLGRRTRERVFRQARDVVLAQMNLLVINDDVEEKRAMAAYVRDQLAEYMRRDCVPPVWGEDYNDNGDDENNNNSTNSNAGNANGSQPQQRQRQDGNTAAAAAMSTVATITASTGNIMIRRRRDDDDTANPIIPTRRPNNRRMLPPLNLNNSLGVAHRRRPGCPCCNPNDAAVIADLFL